MQVREIIACGVTKRILLFKTDDKRMAAENIFEKRRTRARKSNKENMPEGAAIGAGRVISVCERQCCGIRQELFGKPDNIRQRSFGPWRIVVADMNRFQFNIAFLI